MTPEVEQKIRLISKGQAPEGYRKTPAGIVPQDWAEYSLGEVYTERKQAGDPSLPVLSVSIHTGVSDGELDEETLGKKVKRIEDKTQYRTALEGDLVFNMMRAWQGAIGVARSRGLVSPAYIVAKPGDRIYPPFMDYYMKTPRMINWIQRMSYGVTDFRLRLYWDSFEQIPCVLPPLHEQQRIVEILKVQDTILDLGQQRIEQIKRMKKELLKKMFPQKDSAMPEMRFPGFTAPWEQRKFSDLAETRRGLTYNPSNVRASGIRILRSSNITEDQFTYGDEDVFVEQDAVNIPYANCGDILITSANGSTRLVGKHAIIRDIPNNLAVHGGFMLLATAKNPEFVNALMSAPWYSRFISLYVAGGNGAIGNLNKNDLDDQDVVVPDGAEQKVIGEFFHQLDNLITLHQRALETEQKKKKALMQLLLTGLVRVKV